MLFLTFNIQFSFFVIQGEGELVRNSLERSCKCQYHNFCMSTQNSGWQRNDAKFSQYTSTLAAAALHLSRKASRSLPNGA